MATGVSIANNYGSIIVNENFKNDYLVRKGTVTISSRSSYDFTSVNFSGVAPKFAFRENTGGKMVGVTSIDYYNGTYTANMVCSDTPATITYYIFDTVPDNLPSLGYFSVRDGQGRLTFDSNLKYLRLIDFVSGNGRTAPKVAGVTEAAIICSPNMQQWGGGGGFSTVASAVADFGFGYDLAYLNMGYTDTSDGGTINSNEPTYDYPTSVMIIDVTGY
ncbi:hypothetical protein [uncultured Sphingomonas sp.]|uniref:hypothetical protein n=1 Tax=uncultured Sphingomonas sp. TaxID=158754 RepID=UPI0025FF0E47|nr:hypothetical protein [uncultured Sphingomonas sp.]